jgi:hypothetical protein
VPGCELLRDYYWAQGDKDRAQHWHARYAERTARLEEARAERDEITIKDRWLPHGLDAEARAALSAQLARIPELRRAWLVRKDVRQFAEDPLFVLGYRVTPWYRLTDTAAGGRVMAQLREQVTWPGETFLINVEGKYYRFGRKFWRHRGARIL